MLRLTTLGALDLRDRLGHPIREVMSQPKRLALLSYLVLEGRQGPVLRDRLLAMFWPESDDAHARNALSQALHHLRQALGPDLVESRGANTLIVHSDALWCDAVVFADALEQGDTELALDLYRGEFCPALFVSGAPEVEEWLSIRRQALRREALAAARSLAERLETSGNAAAAALAARRALALRPDDEGDVRALIALLERAGDAAGAVSAYQEFSRRLMIELELEPAPETTQLAESIRRRREQAATAGTVGIPGEIGTTVTSVAPVVLRPRAARWRRRAVIGAAVTLAIVATLVASRRSASVRLDPQLAVILPFRVSGADSALAFLREGIVDLIAAKLAAEGGLRAVDPRTVSGLSPQGTIANEPTMDAGLRIARLVGGGRLLIGSVVGRSNRFTIAAQLVDTRSGSAGASAVVEGRLDSLAEMVDAITARLLSENAAEPSTRLSALTTASIPALKAYLLGRSAFRAGRYEAATGQLRRAVDLDSGFAIGWLELVQVSDWGAGTQAAEVRRRAWALRNRLSAVDRSYLVAMVGPRFPAWPSVSEWFDGWERIVRLAPESPEAWYGLGDAYFHHGQLLGRDSGFVRAEEAFARAVALDSSSTSPLAHLVQITVMRGDTARARRLAMLYAARDSTGEVGVYLRWRVAVALGDSSTARAIESALDTLPPGVLRRMAEWAQFDGVAVDASWRAAQVYLRRATGEGEQYGERLFSSVAASTGRFAARWPVQRRIEQWARVPEADSDSHRISESIFQDGDPGPGRAIVARLVRAPRLVEAAVTPCIRIEWNLVGPDRAVDTVGDGDLLRDCLTESQDPQGKLLLRALYAARSGRPDWEQLLASVDSLRMAQNVGAGPWLAIIEGEMLTFRGQFARARDVYRRREMGGVESAVYLAPLLRREGRVAALAHDTDGAIRAYRHYLALRYDPDPVVRFYADTVRAALARLERPRQAR